MNSEPTIEGNIITGNEAITGGGGIYMVSDRRIYRPHILSNRIHRNKAINGGGIACRGTQSPVVRGNIISENEATLGDGAGIWLFTSVDGAVISDNNLVNGMAGDHGGGIYAVQENPSGLPIDIEISWNVISSNGALWSSQVAASGGGLWLQRTSAWVHHNTIVTNVGGGPDNTSGGGIVLDRFGSPIVEKNIIAQTQSGGGIWCGDGVTPIIRNNLSWQNVGGDGVGDCATWWQTDGNVVTDPYFCSPTSGDYSVAQNSPALTHVAGPLGAFHLPGCGPVSVQRTTWGRIKTLYK